MKLLVIAFSLFVSLSSMACPNLAGTYESINEDGVPERFVVNQNGCNEVGYIFNQDVVNLIADNNERLVLSKKESTEMGDVSLNLFAKGYFSSNALFINQRIEIIFFGQAQTQHSSATISLTGNGDIVTVTKDSNGTRTEIAKRIK